MTKTFGRAILGAALLGATVLSVAPASASGWSQRASGDVGIGNGRAGYHYLHRGNGGWNAGNGYGPEYGYGYNRAYGPAYNGDVEYDGGY